MREKNMGIYNYGTIRKKISIVLKKKEEEMV
jgi:hypothetical protein